ncbi:sarcoplasmic calcium-binding protein-like [Babylonia areolata]|uniref:sarcoplasmic calcium-binding protein-like n=1 Tax=Babylonia areolata TaxID=304850 RepID=UPI003FD52BD1
MATISSEDIKFTPFTEAKIRVWFKMIDVGKDGHMCKNDFMAIADRFVKEYSLSEEKAGEIRDWLVDGWNIVLDMDQQEESVEEMMSKMPLVVAMGSSMRAGSKISEDDFTAAYGQLIAVYPRLARESLEKMVTTFFEVFDNNSDNYISEDEMTSAMRCFGYDHPELVKAAFTCLDNDQDGKLSRQEYVGGWVNFMLGQDRDNPFVRAFAPHLFE